jgi:hypothetical protein
VACFIGEWESYRLLPTKLCNLPWRGVSWYRQMTSDGEHSEQILELRVTLAKLKQRPPRDGELRLADDDREILLIKLLL